ncbi:WD40/YVTN/BNR-like repeat-containing protein [Shewanella violacea]|uniref:BNR repeat protein n=1 Tax=Shewanella violacea (strain JCM 10179 / CIP 106290 / LMG 19151 / DSS12) TaxID=637905 RepID=D4ZJH7_SHEVD|nr:YCF48-related protein [Shewanella violacea]BAJ01826.1 BNR repeat protein [Shewanella violacea DSS12]
MLFSMLRSVSICLFLIISFQPSALEIDPSYVKGQIQALAIDSIILDIATNGDTVLAVGERGHVFIFDEQASPQWQQVSSPTRAHLTKAFLITPQLGWAVGHDATIIHTRDGGETWQLQMESKEIEKPLLDIHFFDELNGIAVGAYGLFYRTSDGGESWKSEYHQELLFEEDVDYLAELKAEDEALYLSERSTLLPHFNRVISTIDGQLVMVGELGLVAVSNDQGRNWQKLDFIYEGSMFNAVYVKDTLFVMGLRGHVFKTDASMTNWIEISLPVTSTINGVMVKKDGKLRLVGNAGVVIDVTLAGKSQLIEQRQGENLVSIAQDPQGHTWIAGTKGLFKQQ